MSRSRFHNNAKTDTRSLPTRCDSNESYISGFDQERVEDKHISLSELYLNVESISKIPTFIQGKEKNILLFSIVGNILGLILLKFIIPAVSEFILSNSKEGFFSITAGLAQSWVSFTATLQPVLFWTITISLILSLTVVLLTFGMTKAVHEPVHWLAWAAPLAPSVSAGIFVVVLFLLSGLFVITLVLWIIIITVTIAVVLFILAALLNG